MLLTKNDLKIYLKEDSKNYQTQSKSIFRRLKCNLNSSPISDQSKIWKYIYTMRYVEYHKSQKGLFHKILSLYYGYKLRKLAYLTGFQIPPNTCGKGLTIWHWGTIIINPKAVIGDYCTLNAGVLIGHKEEGLPAPKIGNNVFIGSGSKIIGDVKIGDNVVIAPNSVVVKDVSNSLVVGGIPAKILK